MTEASLSANTLSILDLFVERRGIMYGVPGTVVPGTDDVMKIESPSGRQPRFVFGLSGSI